MSDQERVRWCLRVYRALDLHRAEFESYTVVGVSDFHTAEFQSYCRRSLRVTVGSLRVTVGSLRVTVGNLRVTVGSLRFTVGSHRVTVGSVSDVLYVLGVLGLL